MPPLFSPRANLISRSLLGAFVLLSSATVVLGWVYPRSDYARGVGQTVSQPVPFSHAHHAGGLGIDCRYCHQRVETEATAGMPSTEVCMHCHSQVWTQAPLLEPLRESWRSGRAIAWNRVHDTPDFVFFDHSVHVRNGISCVECHGHVEQMPLVARRSTLLMKWCLDCHRHPDINVSPENRPLNPALGPIAGSISLGVPRTNDAGIETGLLTNCSACHR